jgi:hypothetical protein
MALRALKPLAQRSLHYSRKWVRQRMHMTSNGVGFYAHDPSVMLIFDGEAIIGWDAIFDKQREWWQNGKTDVVYTMQGKPDFRVPAPSVVVTTLFMKSRRTAPGGEIKEGARRRGGEVFSVWPGCSGIPTLARRRRPRGVTLTATLRHPASPRPCRTIQSPAFGRSDEILYLVGKASNLTLPDSVRCHFHVASFARFSSSPSPTPHGQSCPGVRQGVAHPCGKTP